MIVAVSVATVWTSPESPRELDRPALQNPADIGGWVNSLSVEDRLQLNRDNLVQTQALYGTKVEVIEERADWVKVVIPDQSTHKEERGYPGWVPRRQLAFAPDFERDLGGRLAVVKSRTAFLYKSQADQGSEISFLTRLPVLASDERWTTVSTPHGPQLIKTAEVAIGDSLPEIGRNTGESIVETGKMFLGLPYLWGGMSGFGYDCSGFAHSMHRAYGIVIPRDAGDQSKRGKRIERADLQPGDLLFFAHDEGKGRIHHVGIFIGDNRMIHSPESKKCIEILDLTGHKLEKELIIARRYW
jgi:cell wall-associated NlpC family hydrolase